MGTKTKRDQANEARKTIIKEIVAGVEAARDEAPDFIPPFAAMAAAASLIIHTGGDNK